MTVSMKDQIEELASSLHSKARDYAKRTESVGVASELHGVADALDMLLRDEYWSKPPLTPDPSYDLLMRQLLEQGGQDEGNIAGAFEEMRLLHHDAALFGLWSTGQIKASGLSPRGEILWSKA